MEMSTGLKDRLFKDVPREIDLGPMTLTCIVEKVEKGEYMPRITLSFMLIDHTGALESQVVRQTVDLSAKLKLMNFDRVFNITLG